MRHFYRNGVRIENERGVLVARGVALCGHVPGAGDKEPGDARCPECLSLCEPGEELAPQGLAEQERGNA